MPGDAFHSDPLREKHDQRAFLLLRTRAPLSGTVSLVHGWHSIEHGAWRWTERTFAVSCGTLETGGPRSLTLHLAIPELVFSRYPSVTLSAAVNGLPLGTETYTKPGEYTYARELPAGMRAEALVIHFELDRALTPDEADKRERGIIVTSIEVR
ncbi:MAG: hypothetical protein M1541_18495 [Acidobacteria bacterium]|nr:hypothetical protein [Acidobacteriota bacterium]